MKKIMINWTCSDYCHHLHRFKWIAYLCGRIQSFKRLWNTKPKYKIAPLLNILYAARHWRDHVINRGWVNDVFSPICHKWEIQWQLILYCPVCTITAAFRWVVKEMRRYAR